MADPVNGNLKLSVADRKPVVPAINPMAGLKGQKDDRTAFKSYLSEGRIGDVKDYWPGMEMAIEWIHKAGGDLVRERPEKYRMSRTKLAVLIGDFKRFGGRAMEIFSAQQTEEVTKTLVRFSESQSLRSSYGSDFHGPGRPWSENGKVPELPPRCSPVCEGWF